MKKILLIGRKDLTLAFRDRAALLLMLAAPFLLTLGLGFVTGRLSGSASSALADIPVIVVNQDGEQLGDALANLFGSAGSGLADRTVRNRRPGSRPPAGGRGYSRGGDHHPGRLHPEHHPGRGRRPERRRLCPSNSTPTRRGRPASGVIKTILDDFMSQVEVGRVGGQVAVTQLIERGLIRPQDAADHGAAIGAALGGAGRTQRLAQPSGSPDASGGEPVGFDALAYMAPGMALMFLMFTATNGGRTLLTERAQGTLPRLLVSPTTPTQVLGGKIFGIYLTGAAQMLILIAASTLLFGLRWGDPLGVLVLILAAVVGAVGLGHADHRPGATPGAGLQDRLGGDADLWHPGRLICQHGKPAGVVSDPQQDHAQCLGAGRFRDPGTGRRPGRYPGADGGPAAHGRDVVHRGGAPPDQPRPGPAVMEAFYGQIFTIIRKDISLRFAEPSECSSS